MVPSPEPDTIHRPSGEYASDHTTFPRVEGGEWEGRSVGLSMLMLSAVDHMRTVSSIEPDTTWRPSGEKQTDVTQEKWPSKEANSLPVYTSQSFRVLSSDPEMIESPEGEKATERTTSV